MENIYKGFKDAGVAHPEFSLAGFAGWARVISVYDADTITVVMPFHAVWYKFSLRVLGIDTCEMKAKMEGARDLGYRARNRMIELVTKRKYPLSARATRGEVDAFLRSEVYLVWIVCNEMDKYGRVLASIRSEPNEPEFGECLVRERLAYEYLGGTKLTEEQQVALLTSPAAVDICIGFQVTDNKK